MVVVAALSALSGPLDGAFSVSKKGGETLSSAAFLELYKASSVLSPRSGGGVWNRLVTALGTALRGTRSP